MQLTGYTMVGSLNVFVTRGSASVRLLMRDTPAKCRAELDQAIKQVYKASSG